VTIATLDRALSEPPMRPLPAPAAELLRELDAPPRLGAHLRAVHDVAWSLTDAIGRRWPDLDFDTTAVLFGAATHDIGKVVHVEELTGPGSAHEAAGADLLLRYGVPAHLARFAGSHGSCWTRPSATVDELLVSLSDQVWKGKRVPELEHRVIEATGRTPWEAFLDLDDILSRLAADADARLAFQNSYPVLRPPGPTG
jgi:HD domain